RLTPVADHFDPDLFEQGVEFPPVYRETCNPSEVPPCLRLRSVYLVEHCLLEVFGDGDVNETLLEPLLPFLVIVAVLRGRPHRLCFLVETLDLSPQRVLLILRGFEFIPDHS